MSQGGIDSELHERRLTGQELAQDDGVRPLAKHGTNQHSEGGSERTSSLKRGDNAAYLVAHLKRDAPE